jgi:putative peptidoglycan lipid II flippase
MTPDSTPSRRVGRSTLIVMGGMLLALLTGLVRQRVIAAGFGTGATLDAYTAANGLPELLVTMLGGGALSFAFIPVYSGFLSRQDRPGADQLASQVIHAIFLLAALASSLAALLAPALVRAPWGIGPRFPPETQALTVQLMRVLLVSVVIFSMSSILTGTLHAHQHFLLPALAPILYNGGVIVGAVWLAPRLGIFGLAWGAVLGAGLHLLVQLPGAARLRMRWHPGLRLNDPAFRMVAVLMAPRVVDLLMARASIDWLNSNLGSGLGEGRLSALRYAFQVMNMPWTLVGTAIGIAVFPTLAALAAQNDSAALRRAVSGALRAILALTVPAAAGLLVLGRPIVQVLFEGGEFTARSTDLVVYALRFYTLALLSQSALEVVVRAFAARKDTLTPLLVSFFTTALNVGLALWLARPIAQGGLEHGGLALANGAAVAVEACIGLVILHLRWRGVEGRRILADLARAALAAAAMAGVVLLVARVGRLEGLPLLLVGGGVGAVVYFSVALLLGMDEIRSLPRDLLARRAALDSRETG